MTFRVFSVGSDRNVIDMFSKTIPFEVVDKISAADIVVFPGGADVNPELYGEKALGCTHIYRQADLRDVDAWGKSSDKLKIGICRGGQFLNVMNGGKMYQDVTDHGGIHPAIDFVTGNTVHVVSTHHQMMIPHQKGILLCGAERRSKHYKTWDHPNGVPNELKPNYDNEVIWYEDSRSLCFQPHPEYGPGPTRTYFFEILQRIL